MKEIPFFPYSSVFLDNTERYNLILKKSVIKWFIHNAGGAFTL